MNCRGAVMARKSRKAGSNDDAPAVSAPEPAVEPVGAEDAKNQRPSRLGKFLAVLKTVSDTVSQLKVVLGFAAAIPIVLLTVFLVWATRAPSVTIEPFDVPGSMSANGYTDRVVAAKFLDQLSKINREAKSLRREDLPIASWTRAPKIAVAELSAGKILMAIGEALGTQKKITGEITRAKSDLRLTVRATGLQSVSVVGPEGDIDKLIQQSAEGFAQQLSPYIYGTYLLRSNRVDEAIVTYRTLAMVGPPSERAWGYSGWSSALVTQTQYRAAAGKAAIAVRLDPKHVLARSTLLSCEQALGHDAAARREAEALARLLRNPKVGNLGESAGRVIQLDARLRLHEYGADFAAAADDARAISRLPDYQGYTSYSPGAEVQDLVSAHEIEQAKLVMQDERVRANRVQFLFGQYRLDLAMDEPRKALAVLLELDTLATQIGPAADTVRKTMLFPELALMYVVLGDVASAARFSDQTPLDCYGCRLARAVVASGRGDQSLAEAEFNAAFAQGPGLPFGYYALGEDLRRRGQGRRALEAYAMAHRLSPRWPDPLVARGEVLLSQGDARGAAQNFALAAPNAPRWGHLYLQRALAAKAARSGEAAGLFAQAARLPLSGADREILAKQGG